MMMNKQSLSFGLLFSLLSLVACANNTTAPGVEADRPIKTSSLDSTAKKFSVECPSDARPAMMIVEGDNDKPEQFKEYTNALIASKLYPSLKGYYSALGDPADVFEGKWPEKKFAVIARFPCLARAQQFWYSEAYQKIKPLREGAGDVRVVVFEELPTPEYIDWNKK